MTVKGAVSRALGGARNGGAAAPGKPVDETTDATTGDHCDD